jgi:hypothetical protein
MPVAFKDLSDELNITKFQLAKLRDQKLAPNEYYAEEGRKFFTDEGAEKIRLAVAVPMAVPKRVKMRVIRKAPNPHWVYAVLETGGSVIPVAVRPRDSDRLVGKPIFADVIADANGTTYRHEVLGRYS